MDIIQTIRTYYSGTLFAGVALLGLASVFAFIEFSKTKTDNYLWRALSITSFVLACVVLVGLTMFVGYGRLCSSPVGVVQGGHMRNVSDIELNVN
ncbi:Essential IMV membrane protein [Sea otter poxvirus]|uniref:Essential IMV membrane protein n=1 Tax=Sea otter poxvirus TaxID=1416741 RepID=A0A2U9QHS3_9POXV|nr:Essential IMV membrane protein [Sea otter poxvirus]AWU47148.1 Essential IMV membrane protein [Sea otter poxvirus]